MSPPVVSELPKQARRKRGNIVGKVKPNLSRAIHAISFGNMIGEGSYRRVFRTPRGKWVYKVDYSEGARRIGSNAYEWKTYQKFFNSETLPANVRIPEMHYISGGIIAAEYIKGIEPENDCYRDYHVDLCPGVDKCWAEVVKNVGIADIHYQNVLITKDGTIYIIDLGHGES